MVWVYFYINDIYKCLGFKNKSRGWIGVSLNTPGILNWKYGKKDNYWTHHIFNTDFKYLAALHINLPDVEQHTILHLVFNIFDFSSSNLPWLIVGEWKGGGGLVGSNKREGVGEVWLKSLKERGESYEHKIFYWVIEQILQGCRRESYNI